MIQAVAAVNLPLGDNLAIRASGQTVNHDGYLSDGYDDENTKSARLQLFWQPSSDVSLLVNGNFQKVEGNGAGSVLKPQLPGDKFHGAADPAVTAIIAAQPGIGAFLVAPQTDGFIDYTTYAVGAELNWNLGFATLAVLPAYRDAKLRDLSYVPGFGVTQTYRDKQTSVEARLRGRQLRPDLYQQRWTPVGIGLRPQHLERGGLHPGVPLSVRQPGQPARQSGRRHSGHPAPAAHLRRQGPRELLATPARSEKTGMRRLPFAIAAALAAALISPAIAAPTIPGVVLQAPAVFSFTIGDAKVTALSDGTMPMDLHRMLKGITPAEMDKLLADAFLANPVQPPINCYLIEVGGRTILVDAGMGNLFGPGNGGRLAEALTIAGVRPERIDDILLTHAHPDHIGGLAKNGQPVFPKAIIHIGKPELDFFLDPR